MPLHPDLYTTTDDFSPIISIKSVSFSDATDLPDGPCRALLITVTTGNISFITANGETVTVPVATLGGLNYIRARRIRATGTTITTADVYACY